MGGWRGWFVRLRQLQSGPAWRQILSPSSRGRRASRGRARSTARPAPAHVVPPPPHPRYRNGRPRARMYRKYPPERNGSARIPLPSRVGRRALPPRPRRAAERGPRERAALPTGATRSALTAVPAPCCAGGSRKRGCTRRCCPFSDTPPGQNNPFVAGKQSPCHPSRPPSPLWRGLNPNKGPAQLNSLPPQQGPQPGSSFLVLLPVWGLVRTACGINGLKMHIATQNSYPDTTLLTQLRKDENRATCLFLHRLQHYKACKDLIFRPGLG